MAQVLVEKPVIFSGVWRPRFSVDDAFFRTISQEFQDKPGAKPASWRLSTEGLTILAQRAATAGAGGSGSGGGGGSVRRRGQSDQIPVQAIKEVTVNRYNLLCLMTLFVDSDRRFNALVCRCQSEQDAAYIVQVFRRFQKSLSGEGFRIDLKQPQGINWTLKPKQNGEHDGEGGEDHTVDLSQGSLSQNQYHLHKNGERVTTTYTDSRQSNNQTNNNNNNDNNNPGEVVVVEVEEESLEREALEVDGRPCFNVGVQADLPSTEDDNVSMTSEMSYQSLKDELEVLSNEVRDIKILLEQTTGISAEEFFRRRGRRDPDAAPSLVPVKRHLSQESEAGNTRRSNGEKSVNFANVPAPDGGGVVGGAQEEEDMEFDIRSIGMQTMETQSKRGKYLKRMRQVLTPSRYQNRSRSHSSTSSHGSSPGPAAASPLLSPFSPNRPGHERSTVFFGSSVSSFPSASSSQGRIYHRDSRPLSSSSLPRGPAVYSSGGTVVRPIESVYQAHTPGFRQRRRQVVVLPNRSASMPRHYRSTGRSPASSGHHTVLTAKTSADSAATAAAAAQNGVL